MEFDALLLSRLQFAFTIAFHIIFPSFTIGLASFLARLEAQWLWTGNPMYRNLYRFWVKVFAVSFEARGHAVASTEILLRGHADFGEPTLIDVKDGRAWLVANSPWPLYPDDDSGPTETVDPLVVLELDLD